MRRLQTATIIAAQNAASGHRQCPPEDVSVNHHGLNVAVVLAFYNARGERRIAVPFEHRSEVSHARQIARYGAFKSSA